MTLHRKDHLRARWGLTIIEALPADGTAMTLADLSAATGCPVATLSRAIGQMPGSVVKVERGRQVNLYRRCLSLCVTHA